MKIGVFGHSLACSQKNDFKLWTNKIAKYYSACLINYATPHCSEERILFNLKKDNSLDIVIIVHASPRYMFVPGWDRDVDSLDRNTLETKVGLDFIKALQKEYNVDNNEIKKISLKELKELTNSWLSIPDNTVYNVLERLNKENATSLIESWNILKTENDINMLLKKFVFQHTEKTDYYFNLIKCLLLCKKYMFHVDLQHNRHIGALIQIDKYLAAKQIPAVHCVMAEHYIPDWFSFLSGVVDYEISKFQKSEFKESYKTSFNGISEKGNNHIFNIMKNLIEAARIEWPYAR